MLAFEIAVDSLAVAVVGLGGRVREIVRVDRPRMHCTVDEIAADLLDLASSVRARRPAADRIIGIGVAVVGVVRRTDGLVSMAPNLGWRDVPLGERLSQKFDLRVPISVANEADLGALAELRRGVGRGVDNMLFLSGEVGVGGGLISDGKALIGIAGYGGEVGHIPVNPNGVECRCGSTGCWETEIGEDALLTRAGLAAEGGRTGVDLVLRRAAEGAPTELAAVETIAHWLGFGLAGLVNLLNPRLIVLGGRFARLYPLVSRIVEEELDRRALAAPRALVRVVPATLGVDAPLLGAAELAFEPLLADPMTWSGARNAPISMASA